MADIKVIETKSCVTDEGELVITRLQEALAMARDGQLVSVAIAGITDDGDIVSCWANSIQPFAMVGAIESLKIDYIEASIERRQ